MLSLTAHWHKTLSSDMQDPLWLAKIMAAKNKTVLFELEVAFHKNGSITFIFKRKLFFLWLMVWITKICFRLVFREVLQALQDWFSALTKRIKRVTRKQEESFSMYFWHFRVTFDFNLIFLSDLMKKYHSFQFSGYILMLTYANRYITCHLSQK